MEVVGGRRRYWFQNCSVELDDDGEDSEEAEEGVEQTLETEEVRDLNKLCGSSFCEPKVAHIEPYL